MIKSVLPKQQFPNMSKGTQTLERFIFWSRWLQAPLYLGLIVAQGIYVWLIDIVMIANLLIMVIIGGYETFVSRLDLDDHPDQPEWLSHVNAGVLKIKLSTAIIGISSIHLLKTFINAANISEHTIMWQVIIHVVFLVSAFAMALVDKMMNQTVLLTKH